MKIVEMQVERFDSVFESSVDISICHLASIRERNWEVCSDHGVGVRGVADKVVKSAD